MTGEPGDRRSVVSIGIGASALREAESDPALQRAIHEELLEELAVHGELVFTSSADLERFLAAVGNLPTTLAKAWEAVLSSRRVSVTIADPASDPALDQVVDAGRLETRLASEMQLVLLESEQAELLGVPADQFSVRSPGRLVEIGRISTATRTTSLLTARQVLDAPMREGTSRDVEWDERFGPLVAASTLIVVYDKYVGAQVVRRYLHSQPGDGLTWFLTRVARDPGRKVRVITAVMPDPRRGPSIDERSLAASFAALDESLDRRVNLDLVLVPESVTGRGRTIDKFGHDRHIRFGHRTALALGTGIQAFSRGNLIETITVARLPVQDARDREERAIRASLRPPPGGWITSGRIHQ